MTGSRREWIAERTLRAGKGRGRVLVRLEKPRKVSDDTWTCRAEIRRGKATVILDRDIHGTDSFQALLLALEVIRAELDKLPGPLTWEYETSGDVGFPRFVTSCFGFPLQQRLEAMVESETERYSDEMARIIRRIEHARDPAEKAAAKRDFRALRRSGGAPGRRRK